MSIKAEPNESDAALAARASEYIINMFDYTPRGYRYWLLIFHDCRVNSKQGKCPVGIDWHRKNVAGIKTSDKIRAESWTRQALLAGYAVFRCSHGSHNGYGPGSLKDMREQK